MKINVSCVQMYPKVGDFDYNLGKMYDFVSPGVDAAALCGAFGRVDSVELTVYGVCNECLSSTQGEEQ